jgi:hypothetical protein
MAESSINYQYIENYSKEFAGLVTSGFLKNKSRITGREILEVTEIKQVNLLIISDLYSAWQSEIERLKGPYFNYESPEVLAALSNLSNVLSNNILIEKHVFEPLLARAVEKTLLLTFSPYEFFISLINSLQKEKIYYQELKNERKYIKINVHLYDAFLRNLEERKILMETRNAIIDIFNEVCERFSDTPDDPDPYINTFSKILAFNLKLAYHEKEITSRTGGKQKSTIEFTVTPAARADKKTLLDEFLNTKTDTIADFLKRKTIESIRKSITINQKFMFVKELFKEDETLFNKVINDLDNLENLEQAANYLEENFFNNNLWNRESETVVEFIEVLEKKFA